MKLKFKLVEGAVVAAQGFRTAGVFCDIKRLGTGKGSNKGPKRDLTLIVSEVPCSVAGMFTTNQICAAPVKVCVARVAKGIAQAVVVNSANANACTGQQGLKDALVMTRLTEQTLGLKEGYALVGSTGRIWGEPADGAGQFRHRRRRAVAGKFARPRRAGGRGDHDQRHAAEANRH